MISEEVFEIYLARRIGQLLGQKIAISDNLGEISVQQIDGYDIDAPGVMERGNFLVTVGGKKVDAVGIVKRVAAVMEEIYNTDNYVWSCNVAAKEISQKDVPSKTVYACIWNISFTLEDEYVF